MTSTAISRRIAGVGLGLRWDFIEEVASGPELPVDFFEFSPENYLRRRGWIPDRLMDVAARYPMSSHGLSLSIGSTRELDRRLVSELSALFKRIEVPWHSDHLCLASTHGRHFHDLLPMLRNRASVRRVVERVRQLKEALERPFLLENISYYSEVGASTLSEAEFLSEVLEAGDCGLLLDVNNVYVNSINHGFIPEQFIDQLPLARVQEIHVAGHLKQSDGTLIDTHGTPIIEPVYQLLDYVLRKTGPVPVLLERDNDVPTLSVLLDELDQVRSVVKTAQNGNIAA